MKIYIVGSGAVGGYFGGLLARSENDVTFVARGKHFGEIKKRGLSVKSIKSGNFIIKPAKVIDKISKIKDPDFVMFTVKTYDTEDAAKELAKVVLPKTNVITFQNGIENDLEIKKHVKTANVYPGVAYVISVKTNPAMIEQKGGLCKLIFGDRKKSKNKRLEDIEKMMIDAGIDANVSDDIERDLWKKFVFISAFSGTTAICRSTVRNVLSDTTTRGLYERCVKESISVAEKLGVKIPRDIYDTVMQISKVTSEDSKSSLLVDIETGNRNEIETLNGTIVRHARKLQIDVPVNETIYGAIKLLNEENIKK